ncbi:hypothetical protein HK405_011211 [Cladochytrium tenue]|nr:hypothetical protein HK405_011211 [Cladochytrium tenue]
MDGPQCKISWGLDVRGYCKRHVRQGLPRCEGITIKGKPCTITDLDSDGRCKYHPILRCLGTVHQTGLPGKPCKKRPKEGYAYCCAAHDPEKPWISPNKFVPEDVDLRSRYEGSVVQLYHRRDPYNDTSLATRANLELDHILEKQCYSHIVVLAELDKEDQDQIVDALRDEVVNNEKHNLCLTLKDTNQLKGAGVFGFLDDRTTGHLSYDFGGKPLKSFTAYLIEASSDNADARKARLSRETSGRICAEMGRSARNTRNWLADQGEISSFQRVAEQVQDLIVEMGLNTSTQAS